MPGSDKNLGRTPSTVVVGGFASEVGKTTLMCELLRAFPAWEAIKLTRGHYRSCGKDPEVCCVAHLLRDEPLVLSGRESNHLPGKDTGRYWDSGASNVHWVIVTDNQVQKGISRAIGRVRAPGVFIEGNSLLDFMVVNFTVIVARAEGGKIKPTARRALPKADALFLSGNMEGPVVRDHFTKWCADPVDSALVRHLPIYTREDLPRLLELIHSRLVS